LGRSLDGRVQAVDRTHEDGERESAALWQQLLIALRRFLDIMELLDRIEHVASVNTSRVYAYSCFLEIDFHADYCSIHPGGHEENYSFQIGTKE